jgi:Galactose oxidase, central domain
VLDSLLAGLCRMPKNFRAIMVQRLLLALLCANLTICASTAAAQADTFAGTGNMVTPRGEQTATLLNNGKVLIAGGFVVNFIKIGFVVNEVSSGLASAELYDPVTASFTATGEMTSPRFFHTATLLNNGKVLLTGGAAVPGGDPVASAELYDPATGTFTATGNMSAARSEHTATVLGDGKVLVSGGVAAMGKCLLREASPAVTPVSRVGNSTIPQRESLPLLVT